MISFYVPDLHSGGKRGRRKSTLKSGDKVGGYQVQKKPYNVIYVFYVVMAIDKFFSVTDQF